MDSFTVLPNTVIPNKGSVSQHFMNIQVTTFREACSYIQNVPYGYSSTREDIFIVFKEGYGSCTTKHAVIATLAEELSLPVYKMIGIYAMNEQIVTGTNRILEKYHLPYLPMIHCFLTYDSYQVDLTEGNDNGKNCSIDTFLFTEKVLPTISEKDEYLLYKNALKQHILKRKEMKGITMLDVLHGRSEGIALLRSKVTPNL